MHPLRLSDVASSGELEVVADACFENLGFLSDPQPRMLTFVESSRFVRAAERCGASCVITTAEIAASLRAVTGVAIAESPRWAFHRIHQWLATETEFYWTSHASEVDPSARVHPRAWVAERNVRIGPGVTIGPNAVVLERCTVEENVVIGAGVVLGSSGFQTNRGAIGIEDMIHAGGLRVRRGVHVLSNASVATAVFRQSTVVGENARIGNCAFVSHNVQIGREAVVGHGAVVNGNVWVGDGAWIGPGACVANNIRIGAGARVLLGAVAIGDVADGEQVAGNFAIPHRSLLRHLAKVR